MVLNEMTARKRKVMDYDAKEGCKKCGILSPLLGKEWEKDLCRACQCIETARMMFETPCGQHYCRSCGILIEPVGQKQNQSDFCKACTVIQDAYIRPEDFPKAVGSKCQCEFCGSYDELSEQESKRVKLSFKITPKRTFGSLPGVPASEPRRKFESLVEEDIRNKWEREQLAVKKLLQTEDCSAVRKILKEIRKKDTRKTFYIGGVDISFIKDNNVDACAALVIFTFPELMVVYKRMEMIKLTAPYIPGFLAFREVDSIINLYKAMRKNAPQYKPDVILVDGNGQLHPRGFGLACHLGVVLDVPCVGVAKTLIHVDGIEENAEHRAKKETLKHAGDTFPLTTRGGETLGMALRSTKSASNPIYVSVGHKISLRSAVTLVEHCCKYRIPEPTRYADLYSREYLASGKTDPEEFISTVEDEHSDQSDWS